MSIKDNDEQVEHLNKKLDEIKREPTLSGKLKKIVRSLVIPIIMFIGGIYVSAIINKDAEDKAKTPDDKLKITETNSIGLEEAWKTRNQEAIEAYLKLKKEKPEQYVDKLTPRFFKETLLLNDGKNIPFLEKNSNLLKIEEVCEPVDESLLDNPTHNSQKISNMISFYKDSGGGSSYYNYKLHTDTEKEFLLKTCNLNVGKLEAFKNSLDNRKAQQQQKLDEFKKEINNKLIFLDSSIFYKNKNSIIETHFFGVCNPNYTTSNGAMRELTQCIPELENLFGTRIDLYHSVQNIRDEYKNNQEFQQALSDFNFLNIYSKPNTK